MDAVAESGRNPVSKHHIQPKCGAYAGGSGSGRPNFLARPNAQAQQGQGEYIYIYIPVHLRTSSIIVAVDLHFFCCI